MSKPTAAGDTGAVDLEPYYQDDLVTVYNADCADVLPGLDPASVGLLVADPPYGMNHEPTRRSNGSKIWGRERVEGDREPFDPSALLIFPRLVLFGANWYADRLPASGGWIVWDKTPEFVREGFTASAAELAWTNVGSMVRKFSLQWGGACRNHEPHLHPTQKPVGLMRWIVQSYTEPGDLVVDPYMGSGPIAEACRDLGRRYVGVEIKQSYCEAAVGRLSQKTLGFEVSA